MYKKINHSHFVKDFHGAIVIEFVWVFLIISIFIKAMIFVAENYSTMGKLDRISYSLAGIIRERTKLYNDDGLLTQTQAEQLKMLADKMLLSSGFSPQDLSIKIETLHFMPEDSSNIGERAIDNTKSLSFNVGPCEPQKPLQELKNLSSFSNAGRWIPLYQVTLCLSASTHSVTLSNFGWPTIPIMSSAITIER
ncbi:MULTISPECIES: tight adherence pilus pseudopilin TadF [Yersinia]|uniref:tight adherence pilus pseudopilin TadF n=1 Tax=Yersinia TaxID=629 RepID=UPI0005E3BBDE|nr:MULTISPECIES: tight adherence pilus pseudopilin TadF [Yersinia]CNK98424.1 putative tight adherance operon protein [Yersinia frederiksenii]